VRVTYGDIRFVGPGELRGGARVQTFAEGRINIVGFARPRPDEQFVQLDGSPYFFDVTAGPPSRANVVAPSTHDRSDVVVRISLTDACHCLPREGTPVTLRLGACDIACIPGIASENEVAASQLCEFKIFDRATQATWGVVNPSIRVGADGLRPLLGRPARAERAPRDALAEAGLSPARVVQRDLEWHGRRVLRVCAGGRAARLRRADGPGACLTDAWEFCQSKVREYHEPGKFVTFKAYEAGAPNGHRNVIYVSDEIEPPLDARRFSAFEPRTLFAYYRERRDAILIPHHVKTWTDWAFHDPDLEPVMEVYSCWGQSESPSLDLWNKGMTPGAGAWEAFRRGYRMGMMASSDNHVGMPGRSYPGDRQAHTPFKGGLCAIWSPELTRQSLFDALKVRRCYGTTGARIVVRFSIDGKPMGSGITLDGSTKTLRAAVEVHGTDELQSVELVTAARPVRQLLPRRGESRLMADAELPATPGSHYYVRVIQVDGERAWTSPIFMDGVVA
jgi:hypothetical protein